jgi:hypothetical protein
MNDTEREYRDQQVARGLAELPSPGSESPTFFAELHARATMQAPRVIGDLRALATRRPLGFALATAILFALVGGVAVSIAAPRSQAAAGDNLPAGVLALSAAAGWNTLQTKDPNNPQVQFVWAANVPFAAGDSVSGEPINTAKGLPAAGVVVYASSLPTVPDATGYTDTNLPLKLSDGQFVTGQYENQPAPNVSKYMINAHVDGQYVYVEVMFGVPQPTAEMRNEAEQELARLSVP